MRSKSRIASAVESKGDGVGSPEDAPPVVVPIVTTSKCDEGE